METGKKKVKNKKMEFVRLIILLAVFIVLFAIAANRMLFPCRRSYSTLPGLIKLNVGSGIEIAMLYLENPSAKYTVLFSHGNNEDLGTLGEFLEVYKSKGYSVLAWDYRGYGISNGKPSESSLCHDIEKVFEYMTTELGIAPETIILHGRSVGGGPSCDLASKAKCGGLIMESAFMSAFTTRIPWKGIPGDKFLNIDKIDKVTSPVLFIHGKLDMVVPFNHAESLYGKANEPKYNLWLDECGHNDIIWKKEDMFWQSIENYTRELSSDTKN